MRLCLQPAARPNTIQIPVDIQLQQIRGILAWTALLVGPNALESSRLKVEAIDERINETDRVVRSHVVVHSIGQQQKLGTVFTGDMCHDTFYQPPWGTRSQFTDSRPAVADFSHSLVPLCNHVR